MPDDTEVRVWDSTAEIRYMVLPERPAGTERMSEEQLAELVTRDAMIGVATVPAPGARPMNGGHDLGGMHGFGPVEIERDEPVFHHEWERRAFAITLATGFLGKWNIDQSRFAREQMPPAEYLATTYYEHWLFGLEKLLHDQGLVSRDEVAARLLGRGGQARPVADARMLKVEDVEPALRRSRASKADEEVAPRYRVGDRVITRNIHPLGHTRLPRYARSKRGVVALRSRRVGVSGHRGQRPGPQAAALLQRALRGARAVGRRSRRRATRSTSTCGTTTWSRHEHARPVRAARHSP